MQLLVIYMSAGFTTLYCIQLTAYYAVAEDLVNATQRALCQERSTMTRYVYINGAKCTPHWPGRRQRADIQSYIIYYIYHT